MDDKKRIADSMETLAVAWAQIMSDVGFPQDFDGAPTPEAYRAAWLVEDQIRNSIISGGDMRLFSLMHLLGQASLRMEQELWPKEYDQLKREIEVAVLEADNQDAVWIQHEQVKAEWAVKRSALQAKIDAEKNLDKALNVETRVAMHEADEIVRIRRS